MKNQKTKFSIHNDSDIYSSIRNKRVFKRFDLVIFVCKIVIEESTIKTYL